MSLLGVQRLGGPRRISGAGLRPTVLALLVLAAVDLSPIPAVAVSGDLSISVQDFPTDAGYNSYIPFFVAISNSSGTLVEGGSLKIEGPDETHLLTEGCTWVAGSPGYHLCPLEPISSSADVYIQSIPSTAVDGYEPTTFTIVPPDGFSDTDGTNDSDTVSHLIRPDILSLWVTSFPQGAPSGGTLEFQARVKNGSTATTATGVQLELRFSACYPYSDSSPEAGCGGGGPDGTYLDYLTGTQPIVAPAPCSSIALEDQSSEVYDWSRPYLATCDLADVGPGETVLPIRLRAPSCGLPLGATCVLDMSFRVVYEQRGEVGDTYWPNDEDYKPAYINPEDATGGQDASAQDTQIPLADALTTTSLDSDGLSALDPTAAALTLPTGYTGTAAITEVDEEAQQLGVTGVGDVPLTMAAPSSPSLYECYDRAYPLDCQVLNLDLASPITRDDLAYRVRFLFHPSMFRNDQTGKLLKIRSVYLFHDGVQVPSCPNGTKESNYLTKVPDGSPCVLRKGMGGRTGYYTFLVLTGVNGAWKAGR